jgi:hypothetical protein
LNTFSFTFTRVVFYALLQLVAPFNGHVMFKTCQYATNDTKIGVGMKEMSVIDAQSDLQKPLHMDKEIR